jgi:hypothetical protein
MDAALRLHMLVEPGGCVLLAVTTSSLPLPQVLDPATKTGLLAGAMGWQGGLGCGRGSVVTVLPRCCG